MPRSRNPHNQPPDNLVSEPSEGDGRDEGIEGIAPLEGEVANLKSQMAEIQLRSGYQSERIESIAEGINERFVAMETRMNVRLDAMLAMIQQSLHRPPNQPLLPTPPSNPILHQTPPPPNPHREINQPLYQTHNHLPFIPNTSKKFGGSGEPDEDGIVICELSKNRRVSVRSFQGRVMVDIRQFYEKDGKQLPGKQGILLSMDQWKILREHIDDVNEAVAENA